MPKIPLYGEGAGTVVQTPTARLGPRATDVFAAPGQALARAGAEVGRVGSQYAAQKQRFDATKAKLEFDFAMAQKKEQTDNFVSDYTTRAYEQADNFIIQDTQIDTEKSAAGLISSVQEPILNEINGLDLTDSQKKTISSAVKRQLLPKVGQAKQQAFNRGLVDGAIKTNSKLESTLGDIASEADPEIRAMKHAEANQLIRDKTLAGQRLNYSIKTFGTEVTKRIFDTDIASATSFPDINRLKNELEKSELSASTKSGIRRAISAKESELTQKVHDDALNQLIFADLSDSEQVEALAQMRDEKKLGVIVIERDDDEDVIIDLAGASGAFRTRLASMFEAEADALKKSGEKELLETLATEAADMDRSQLQQLIRDADRLEGQADGLGLVAAQSLKRIANGFLDRFNRRLTSQIENDTEVLTVSLEANNGMMTPENKLLRNSIVENISKLKPGDPVPGERFLDKTRAIADAGVAFSGVQFSGPSDIISIRNEMQESLLKSPLDEKLYHKQVLDSFNTMVQNRDNLIKTDAVKYLQDDATRRDLPALTTEQLIRKQRDMGVAEVDIRIASNAEIAAFQAQYSDPSLSYQDKSEIGNAFITKFGAENEGRILRNLVKQDVLSLVDNIIIANPNNAQMFAVDAGNTQQSIKDAKATLGTKTMNEITEAVRLSNDRYAQSVIGGVVGDILGRGATSARMSHVNAYNEVIKNTAAYYMMAGEADVQRAVDKAIDTVVNSQFAFAEGNLNRPLRLPKGLENDAGPISNILSFYVSNDKNKDYLLSIIDPPIAAGLTVEESKAQLKKKLSDAYWVTTTDNKGAYLVFDNGEMVRRKQAAVPGPIGPRNAFVMIRFNELAPQIRDLEQERSPAGRAKIKQRQIF
jgi:hypothetical protein